MKTYLALLCVCLPGVASPLAAADAPTFKPVVLPDAIRFVSVFSPDGVVGTMIFDNFVTSTELGRKDGPNAVTKNFSYVIGTKSDGDVCVRQHIRGFVSLQGGGSASLLIHSGGRATLVDFGKAMKDHATAGPSKSPARTEALKSARVQNFKIREVDPDGNFFVEILTRVPKGEPFRSTFAVVLDRPSDEAASAAVWIDTIDVVIEPPAK